MNILHPLNIKIVTIKYNLYYGLYLSILNRRQRKVETIPFIVKVNFTKRCWLSDIETRSSGSMHGCTLHGMCLLWG